MLVLCSGFQSKRFLCIKVHVLFSGLHSGGPCSLRYMFHVHVSILEVHVHWGPCSMRYIFIEVYVLRIGLHSGGPHSLSYNWHKLFNHTDWWMTDLPRYWCPIHHHRNLLPNGFKYLSFEFWVLHYIRQRIITLLTCFVNFVQNSLSIILAM